MPAGTGRVGGEEAAGPHGLDGLVVAQARVLHELTDPLEAEEAGVALVGVEHLGVDAEGVERPHAADAEEDLLAQAVLGVAAVEAVGDRADLGRVLVDVGVEEVERDAAHLGLARPGPRSGVPAEVDLDAHVVAQTSRAMA